jgi:hypothetical protein
MKTLIAVIGVLGVLAVVLVGSYVSNYNYGNEAETEIKAQYKNMKNILGQYSLKIKEAAQIPSMQTDDLAKLFNGSLGARYGKDGSGAAMQWIKEQNPNLDQSTYKKLQQLIEAGRNKFENTQTRFIDAKRTYETNLGYLWKGMWMRLAGYPKINLADYKIITSNHAKKTFDTGVDEGLQLR